MFLLLAGGLLTLPRPGRCSEWAGGGPEGGRILRLWTLGSTDPTILALTGGGGPYRLGSDGRWVRANEGLPLLQGYSGVSAHGALYVWSAGAGYLEHPRVFRSLDAGVSWTRLGPMPISSSVTALAVDPSNADRMVAIAHGPYVEDVFVVESEDAGASWSLLSAGSHLGYSTRLFIDPGDPELLYTLDSGRLDRSVDGGRTWSWVRGGCSSFAWVPGEPDVFYCGTRETQQYPVVRSPDGGGTWEPASSGLPFGIGVEALAINPADPSRLAVLMRPGLGDAGLLVSNDGGASWRPRLPRPDGYDVKDMIVLPTRRLSVLVATDRGVFRSDIPHRRWLRLEAGMEATRVHTVVAPPGPHGLVLAGALADGPWRSSDAADSWTISKAGYSWGIHPKGLAVAPSAPRTVYAIPVGSDYLRRSRNGGAKWKVLPFDGPPITMLAFQGIAVDPTSADVVVMGLRLATQDDPILLRSTDGGEGWTTLMAADQVPFLPVGVHAVAIDPRNSSRVLAGLSVRTVGVEPEYTCQLMRTDDLGTTWTTLLDMGIPCFYMQLATDPREPFVLYAAGSYFDPISGPRDPDPGIDDGLFRSQDDGASWERLELSPGGLPCALTLAVHPGESTLFAGCDGVYASADRGETWERLPTDGLPSDVRFVISLAFQEIPGKSGSTWLLHAGTNAGVYSIPLDAEAGE